MVIMLPQHCNGIIQLCLRNIGSTGEDDGGGCFDLIVIELPKVLHINLDLTGIGNSHFIANDHIVAGDLFHSGHHIAELANAGGFNHNTVGVVLLDNLSQCLAEVTHQGAADAAGIHLRDVNAGILQKAAVDADFAKFVFNQNKIFALVGFLNHFLDQGGFTGAEEAGININFGHKGASYVSCLPYIIAQFFTFSTPLDKKTPPHQRRCFCK